jgi:DNA-binding helix-hairpin-helix protein with protein kinase domain
MRPPPNTVPLSSFGPTAARLFERAFAPEAPRSSRPTALEWSGALTELESKLVRCGADAAHWNHVQVGCVWCPLERTTGVRFFGFNLPSGASALSALSQTDLQRLLARIKAIELPSMSTPVYLSGQLPPPSPAALSAKPNNALGVLAAAAILGAGLTTLPQLFLIWAAAALYAWATLTTQPEAWRTIQAAHRQATHNWNQLAERIGKLSSSEEFSRTMRDVDEADRTLRGLDEYRRNALAKLESRREELQKQQFLSRYSIEHAQIPGVGPGRKAMLSSFGIDTAADIDYDAIVAIPGFGNSLAVKLVAWRRQCLQHFRFDSRVPVDRQAIGALDQEIDRKRAAALAVLTGAPQKLERIRADLVNQREALLRELEQATAQRRQAEADASA